MNLLFRFWSVYLILLFKNRFSLESNYEDEGENIDKKLEIFDKEFGVFSHFEQLLTWNYMTNITANSEQNLKHFRLNSYDWKHKWNRWALNNTFNCNNSDILWSDIQLKRCHYLNRMNSGLKFQNESDYLKFGQLMTSLTKEYSQLSVKIPNQILIGENEVIQALAQSEDIEQIMSIWNQWYQNSNKMMPYFVSAVDLLNKTVSRDYQTNLWSVWISDLDMKEPLSYAHKLWQEVQPFYRQLHAYIRSRLLNKFGDQIISETESIPIYAMKSLWADQWISLKSIAMPYNRDEYDPIESEQQVYHLDNVNQILSEAQTMFTDLGFPALGEKFWRNSIFTKPDNANIDCHPLALDFMDDNDYRVKLCLTGHADNRKSELRQVVHELGHIYYFAAYSAQPNLFRSAPNSAFHESIGELMVLISNACKWKRNRVDHKELINGLMAEALSNFVIIPWALSVEQWRHDLFVANVSPQSANRYYWQIRQNIEGIAAPRERLFAPNWDPIAKYHIANFIPYLRYFYSRFLSHQLHTAICDHTRDDGLYLCCPKQLDNKFWNFLSSGASLPWNITLKYLTGKSEITAKPLLDYYRPLIKWLQDFNSRNNNTVGWPQFSDNIQS